jgi:hypothetical protein
MRIGFIGVGNMGHGMAKNLLAGGHELRIIGHRNRTPIESLVASGATEAESPKALAEWAEMIFICVNGSHQVEPLMRAEDGILAGARPGLIVVDTSTSEPNSTLALAAELKARGGAMVDAPLGRTPAEAEAGQLDAMVGADPETFEAVRPVIDCWAGRIVHIGDVGDGHKMKLLNNFISIGYAALYSEALALAQKTGIDPKRVDSVIRGSRMDCGFYQTFMSYVLDRNRDAHKFTIDNACKDITYLVAMGQAAKLVNPLASATRNSLAGVVATGHGGDYLPMLSDHIARANGTKLD